MEEFVNNRSLIKTPVPISSAAIRSAIRRGLEYLVRHVAPDGKFDYELDARTGKSSPKYNLLRHAGTTSLLYRLVKSEFDDNGSLVKIANRARSFMTPFLTQVQWKDYSCVCLSQEGIAKLGGTALALIALAEAAKTTEFDAWQAKLVNEMALYLISQQFEDGGFQSKLNLLTDRAFAFRSRYYPGQAILALCEAYQCCSDALFLNRAELGMAFLSNLHCAEPPTPNGYVDHWAMIALSRLYKLTNDTRYSDYLRYLARPLIALDAADIPIWLESDCTTQVSTRLEGLVALLEADLQSTAAEKLNLLQTIFLGLARCLERQIGSTNSQLQGARSDCMGGFIRSSTQLVVRIDYVQHAVAAFFGTLEALSNQNIKYD